MTSRLTRRFERRATAAEWETDNPVLGPGEIGLLIDDSDGLIDLKVGDGSSTWGQLPLFTETIAASAALLANFVESMGGPAHVDLSRTVNAAQRTKRQHLTTTLTGDLVLTLGATPINEEVWIFVEGVPLESNEYSVDGVTVTAFSILAGSYVDWWYNADSDTQPDPANASTNVYDVYDDYNRVVAPTTGTGLGACLTGQTPTIFGGGSWQMDGATLRKGTAGGTPAQDCLYYPTSAADGWLETLFSTAATGASASGIACRGNTSTTRVHAIADGLSVRTSGTDVRQFTASQTLVKGDRSGLLMTGLNFKLYRRPADLGAWQYIGEFTLSSGTAAAFPTLVTSTNHGVRNGSTSNTDTEFTEYIFMAGATAPPAAA